MRLGATLLDVALLSVMRHFTIPPNNTQQYDIRHKGLNSYAAVLIVVTLNVIMLNVGMLSVVLLNVITLNVVAPVI